MNHSLWSRCAQKLMFVGLLASVLMICLIDDTTGDETVVDEQAAIDLVSDPGDRPRDFRKEGPRDKEPRQERPRFENRRPNDIEGKWQRAPQQEPPRRPNAEPRQAPQQGPPHDQQGHHGHGSHGPADRLHRLEKLLNELTHEVAKLRKEMHGDQHLHHHEGHRPNDQRRFEGPPHEGPHGDPRQREFDDRNRDFRNPPQRPDGPPRDDRFQDDRRPRGDGGPNQPRPEFRQPRAERRPAWDDLPEDRKPQEA